MVKAITFPKELERHILRDIDREFIYIIVVCYLLALAGCFIMSQTTIDLSAYEKLQELPTVSVPANVEISSQQSTVDLKKLDKNESQIHQQGTASEISSHASLVNQVGKTLGTALTNIGSTTVFHQAGGRGFGNGNSSGGWNGWGGGPGLGGNGSGTGTGYGNNAPGLIAGTFGNDLTKLNYIGVNTNDAKTLERLGAGGVYIEGKIGHGKIDIASLTPAEIENLIASAKVQPRSAIKILNSTGTIPTAKGRTAADVQSKMQMHSGQIKACYTTVLRHDPNLNGEVAFSFTIKPNGTVSNIQIISDNWSDNQLGNRVETGMRERIATWKFDPVTPNSGDLTVNYSYIFTR